MTLDLAGPFRTSIISSSSIVNLLGEFNSQPCVFTSRPVPDSVQFPLIMVGPDVTLLDQDGVDDDRPVVQRDIAVYGEALKHYRAVEEVGYLLRQLFHRTHNLEPIGYNLVQMQVLGPRIAPVDDDATVGRLISVTVSLARED